MGYDTQYQIEVTGTGAKDCSDNICWELSGGDISLENFNLDFWLADKMKWYTWQRDLLKISGDFPDARIMVTGEGDDSGDNWRAWFRGGELIGYWKQPDFTIPAQAPPGSAANAPELLGVD